MKNKGFTLVELLAVIIIMGFLATIIVPVVNNSIIDNTNTALDITKNNLISATKDWSLNNVELLPNNGSSIKVSLYDLKQGYLPYNVKNPKTNAILSNESYVLVTEVNGDYKYETYIYDIPDKIIDSDVIKFNGNFLTEELNINSSLENYDIDVISSAGEKLNYSKQFILNDAEVSNIDTKTMGVYSIVYTVLYDNSIYKAVKTIIIK